MVQNYELIRMGSSGKSSEEPVLGGAGGRKSFLSNALLISIWGVLVSGHEVIVCGP